MDPIPEKVHKCPELLVRNNHYEGLYLPVTVFLADSEWHVAPIGQDPDAAYYGAQGTPAIVWCPFCGIRLNKTARAKMKGARR